MAQAKGKGTDATKAVGLLIEAANADTVYRDLYLRRARQLLSATLDESAYRAIGSTRERDRRSYAPQPIGGAAAGLGSSG